MATTNYLNPIDRYTRKTLIAARLEATYGAGFNNADPFVEDDFLEVEEASFDYNANNQKFNALRPHMGAAIEVSGNDYCTIKFKMPAHAGSPYTDRSPMLGKLLQACGMTKQVRTAAEATAGLLAYSRYVPDSTVDKSIEFLFQVDGVGVRAYGGRGTFELDMTEGGIPYITFTFTCLFDANIEVRAYIAPEFRYYKTPRVVQARNSSGILLGVAAPQLLSAPFDLTEATGTGGMFASKGFSLSYGNQVAFHGRFGGDRVIISDREITGNVKLQLNATQERDFFNQVRTNTARSFGFAYGLNNGAVVASETLLVYAPAMRFLNPKNETIDGLHYNSYDMRFQTQDKNNDASDNFGDNELQLIYM